MLNSLDMTYKLLMLTILVLLGSKSGNAAELFERVSQSVKVKRYSEALDDLNAAIEADPSLSEAYFHRASVLRQLCRSVFRYYDSFSLNFNFSKCYLQKD